MAKLGENKWTADDYSFLVECVRQARATDPEPSLLQLIKRCQAEYFENSPGSIKAIASTGHADYIYIRDRLVRVPETVPALPVPALPVSVSVPTPTLSDFPRLDSDEIEILKLLPQGMIELHAEFEEMKKQIEELKKLSRREQKVEKPKIAIAGLRPGMFHNLKDACHLRADLELVGGTDEMPRVDYIVMTQSVDHGRQKIARELIGLSRTAVVNGDFASLRNKVHELCNQHYPSN